MEQPPAQQPGFIPEYLRIRSEILETRSPILQLELMEAAIAEGDKGMAEYAFSTLRDLPDARPDAPDRLNPDKFLHTILLTESLVKGGMMDEADQLVAYAKPLDFRVYIEAIDSLLWAGHSGPDGSYLLHGGELVGWADVPRKLKLQYAAHLAAYGQDVFDTRSDLYALFDDSLPEEPVQHQVDQHMLQICRAYARSGQFERAAACADVMRNPYWQREAALEIARLAQAQGQDGLAQEWLARGSNLHAIATCGPSCGRSMCNPPVDVRNLDARAAVVHAMRGDFGRAVELLDSTDPLIAPERREVYARHYEQTGNMASRETAVQAMTTVIDPGVESLAERIRLADAAWGNTLPSLEAPDEVIPLLCWELNGIYARPSEPEMRLQKPEGELERAVLEQLFKVPITNFLQENAAARASLRDHLLAGMVKALEPTAPHTAHALFQLIESYVERSRALIGVARQHGYEGFLKQEPHIEREEDPEGNPTTPEKKTTCIATSDVVLGALKRLLDTFRHRPPG